jgi:tetratricopeptide (TPR) repeat protein
MTAVESGLDNVRAHFREAFRTEPVAAYREWFRLQEELREKDEIEPARMLADDLWSLIQELPFASEEERARFFHNVAVFFGSPGPAADVARARKCFSVALAHFHAHEGSGWHARALHNLASSLSNLGETAEDLAESVALFEQALEWRTAEREIARGVTLHNMGIALRRRAALDPKGARQHLARSASVLREAADIRARHGLSEGHALSLFHLALTLELLEEIGEAADCFARAAAMFDRLGKHDSAAVARERAEAVGRA